MNTSILALTDRITVLQAEYLKAMQELSQARVQRVLELVKVDSK